MASGITFGTRCAKGVGGSGLFGPVCFFPALLVLSRSLPYGIRGINVFRHKTTKKLR